MQLPEALIERLRTCRHAVALTGAGVSAESGVPTFRQAQTGLWARFKPGELATPEAFQRHPRRVWEWYAWRRETVARAAPNPAHLALASLERRLPRITLITQNVDGLHQRAGSRHVIELHGNLTRTRCAVEGRVVDRWDRSGPVPPRCPRCGGPLRPDVVWFGEALPAEALAAAQAASRASDLFLCIGTSTVVFPAAELPFTALATGAGVVEINPEPTPLSVRAHWVLRGRAGEVLPALVRALDTGGG